MNAIDKISKSPIFIYDENGINIRDLRTRAILLKRKHQKKIQVTWAVVCVLIIISMILLYTPIFR